MTVRVEAEENQTQGGSSGEDRRGGGRGNATGDWRGRCGGTVCRNDRRGRCGGAGPVATENRGHSPPHWCPSAPHLTCHHRISPSHRRPTGDVAPLPFRSVHRSLCGGNRRPPPRHGIFLIADQRRGVPPLDAPRRWKNAAVAHVSTRSHNHERLDWHACDGGRVRRDLCAVLVSDSGLCRVAQEAVGGGNDRAWRMEGQRLGARTHTSTVGDTCNARTATGAASPLPTDLAAAKSGRIEVRINGRLGCNEVGECHVHCRARIGASRWRPIDRHTGEGRTWETRRASLRVNISFHGRGSGGGGGGQRKRDSGRPV